MIVAKKNAYNLGTRHDEIVIDKRLKGRDAEVIDDYALQTFLYREAILCLFIGIGTKMSLIIWC